MKYDCVKACYMMFSAWGWYDDDLAFWLNAPSSITTVSAEEYAWLMED